MEVEEVMKILVMHNFHRKGSASGDDQVFKNETALLEAHDNTVIQYTLSNDEFDDAGIIRKVSSAMGMLWSFKNYKKVKALCEREQPDIVHIHTFFPLLSPSILYAAKKTGCKIVATLHDTRFICPCATSLRDGIICNKCSDGRYIRMFKYKCFKGSRVQSLIVAFIFKYHRIRRSFYDQIDKYICLNDNQIELLRKIGFDRRKIVKKYNFVLDKNSDSKTENDNCLPDRYVVYFGRIGEEKGIRYLMKIWEQIKEIPLVVMGGGPIEDEFREWAKKQDKVFFLGYTEHEKCLSIVKRGEFVVFPSVCYEGCSMVEIEAESLGKGIIANKLGFSEEAIKDGINGFKIPLGDINFFVKRIEELWNKPELCKVIGMNARKDYEEKYTPEDNYQQLINIYKSISY